MSLEKWLYYAQAFHLVLRDEPLFSDALEAWKWGPVVPEVYHQYSGFGSGSIVVAHDAPLVELGQSMQTFLTQVVGFLCRHTSMNLSRATHLEAPWIDASDQQDVMPQSAIKSFFRSLMSDFQDILRTRLSRLQLKKVWAYQI